MTVRVSSVSVETIDEASERFVEQIVTEMRRAVRVVTGDLGEVTVAAVEPASIGPDDLGAMRASWRRSVDDRLLATLTASLLHSSTLQASAVNSAVGATLAQPLGQTLLTDLFVDTARNRLVDIGDDLWTNARESLVEGINAGESVPALAKRVRESVDVTTPRATTIARTEVVGAYNRGSIETMRAVGLVTVKLWMSTPDGRTRESHRDADGQQVGLDETFVVGGADLDHPGDPWGPPEEVVNCVVASTEVDAPILKQAMRSWFDGEMIQLRTAAGKTLTVTPDHPVLTTRGWLAAKHLVVGDDVACGDIRRELAWAQNNKHRRPPRIGEIYRAAASSGVPDNGKRMANFHGEWRETEIYIVPEYRELGREVETALPNELEKLGFTTTYFSGTGQRGSGSCVLSLNVDGHVDDDRLTPYGVCLACQASTFGQRRVLHAPSISLALAADRYAALSKTVRDDGARHAELLRQGKHAFTVEISPDQLIRVDRKSFQGYVYNLETSGGWYTGNSIIVKNCRCTMGYEVDESGVDILQEDEDALIAAARDHDGAMIALVPTDADLDRLALEDYEERGELHLTLAYLGDADDWSDEHREAVVNALSTYDWGPSQVDGVAFGVNNWNPTSDTPSWVLAIGAPRDEPDELSNAHAAVWDQLARLRGEFSDLPETPAQHKPWVPHLCLAYGDDPSIRDSMLERLGPLAFDRVRVSFAGNAVDFPLDGTISASALEATVSWYIERGHPDCTDDKPWAVVEVATGKAVGIDATRESALGRIRALTVPPAAQVLPTAEPVQATVDGRAFQEEDCPPGNHRMPDGSCMPDEDMDSSGIVEFTGVAVIEGEPTGDGRQFAPGSLDWPDLETVVVPLQWQKETSHGGINDVTVSVGRLTHLERAGSRIVVGGTIDGGSEDGAEVIRRLRVKTLGGVSIVADDPEQAEVEYVFPEGCPNLEEETPEDLDEIEMKCFFPSLMIFHSGRIRALTIVDTPAFVEAHIELVETETASAGPIFGAVATHETATSDDPWDADVNVDRLDSSMSVNTAREMFAWIDPDAIDDGQVAKSSCKFAHHQVNEDGTVGAANLTACSAVIGALHGSRGASPDILSSDRQGVYDHVAKHLRDADMEPPPLEEIDKLAAALVAASHVVVIPDVPPAEWFQEPSELPAFGAITVTDEGRVYGLLAPRDVAHRSYPDRRVTVPMGNVDYSGWMNRPRIVQEGQRIRTGVITMDCGHASTAPWVDAVAGRDHYENSCSPVATVRIGENSKGVWVAGALLPDVTASQVQRMLACQLSGDWRPHREKSGQREFVAALLVPVPGFPVGAHASLRLDETQLVASAVPVSLEIVGDVSDVELPSDVDDAPVSPAPAPPPAETIPTWEEVQRRRELRAQFDQIAEELGISV